MNVDILMALMQLNHLERIGFGYEEDNDDLVENNFFGLLEKFPNLKCMDIKLVKPQQVSSCFHLIQQGQQIGKTAQYKTCNRRFKAILFATLIYYIIVKFVYILSVAQ